MTLGEQAPIGTLLQGLYFLFVLVAHVTCFQPVRFPAPTSNTLGWHPIAFSRDIGTQPCTVHFIDGDFVAWRAKGNSIVQLRPNVCPHLGSRLIGGARQARNVNGCLQCPYHGVRVGIGGDIGADGTNGKTTDKLGLVWWHPDANTNSEPPFCTEMKDDSDVLTIRLHKDMQCHFNDAWQNAMDWEHAGWVHANTFGNADAISNTREIWQDDGSLKVEFDYVSNERYTKTTGQSTKNYHVFTLPSTTYNKVTSSERHDRYLLLHIGMRATSNVSTSWYITAQSSFLPNNNICKLILWAAVWYIVTVEDGAQLQSMMNPLDPWRRKYSGLVSLPLDGVYDAFNKIS